MQDEINCPHFEECSGCEIKNYQELPLLKEAREFFKSHNVDEVPFIFGPFEGSRYRAKLAVRKGELGLYRKGTHKLISTPFCRVHHPKIGFALQHLQKSIQDLSITSYDESTKQGDIRYVQCIIERSTQRVAITLVVQHDNQKIRELALKLWKDLPLHSVGLNINSRQDNVIFGDEWIHLHGEEILWEKICGIEICFSPSSFGQANLNLFEKLVNEIKNSIPLNSKVVEFYAGVGSIGLSLSDNISSLNCVEVNPHGRDLFYKSAEKLDKKIPLSYHVGDAFKFFHLAEEADVVIVDPPRKGLDEKMLSKLSSLKNKKLIYVSCGFSSFKRDCAVLLEKGWKLEKASLYLFFPGTNHLETLALFSS